MNAINVLKQSGIGLAICAIAACSGNDAGDDGSATGSLTLALIDAPVDDVSEVWVQFDGVTLRRSDGPPIEIPFTSPLSVDLLTLTADNTELLLDGEPVPAGSYTLLALNVSAEHDGVLDSFVVTSAGGQEEIFVPSGDETGLKLVDGLTITANQETSFIIDWDVRMGLENPPGLSGYILRPAFRIIDMTEFGTLSGTVAMSLVTDNNCINDLNADTGNAVYIYEQFDATAEDPDDIGGAGPTPVATAAVTQDQGGNYTYKVILSPGDYTVAFTCQAGNDDATTDDDITFVTPTDVSLTDGALEDVSF